MSPPRSGSLQPSLNVGQDNCGYRLGQQPQSVPKITLEAAETAVNIGRERRTLTLPMSSERIVDKLTELRQTIEAHLSGSVPEVAVHDPLRKFVLEERARGTRAEKVVIALKRSWDSLHEERQRWPREELFQLLDRLVTRCIDDYYGVSSGAPSGRRIPRLGALSCAQNPQPDHDQRTHANPLCGDVQQIRGDHESDDENEEADQVRRER
ncbi:MAG: hypothetical protein ACREMU_13380 [Gemmatimonadaceae bacterium]